jgi:uncharacterized protein
MKSSGVDMSVVLPIATKPSQVKAINEWAQNNSGGSLHFFGAVHPDEEDYYGTIEWLKTAGFLGVKLHPDYQDFFADEGKLFPLYEALRDAGMIVSIHSGVDIGMPVPVRCTPLMLKKIIDNVKGIKLIATHMGGHSLWRDAEELLLGLPVYLDTSYSFYALGREGMERMIERHGDELVLFGTDSPWKSAGDEIEKICSLRLPQKSIDNILFQNALKLLGKS